MESIILPVEHKIVINHFLAFAYPRRSSNISFAAAVTWKSGASWNEFSLRLLMVYRKFHHISLHPGGDILCAYLCVFAIVSETLFSKKLL